MSKDTTWANRMGTYVQEVPNNKYHGDAKFLSSSQVKKAVESPANFMWLTTNSKDEEKKWEKGNAMDFGSLVHAMSMEPHVVEKEFAFIDSTGRNWRTKVDQQYKKNFLEFNSTKIVLAKEDIPRAQICVEAMMNHDFLNAMLEAKGEVEVSGYYRDEFYKRDLRFRPDKLLRDYTIDGKTTDVILDIKTTRDIEGFVKDAKWNFHYDISAYMYVEGHRALTGNMPDFYFGVVENCPPYRVSVWKASENFLLQGKKKYARSMSNINLAMGAKVSHIQWQMTDFEEI